MFRPNSLLKFQETTFKKAGHSKWQNILHRKSAQDKLKAANIGKYRNLISIAIKENNNVIDTNINFDLKNAIDRAMESNVPKKTINALLEKYKNKDASNALKQYIYPVVGKSGVTLIFDCLSENPKHCMSEIKSCVKNIEGTITQQGLHFFEKRGEVMLDFLNEDIAEFDDAKSDEFLDNLTLTLLDLEIEFEELEFQPIDNSEKIGVRVITTFEDTKKIGHLLTSKQEELGCKVLQHEVTYKAHDILEISKEQDPALVKAINRCFQETQSMTDLSGIYTNFKIIENEE
ncbi:hypothetical protein ACO0SA_002001 [Hanseniaspora valbyensis]